MANLGQKDGIYNFITLLLCRRAKWEPAESWPAFLGKKNRDEAIQQLSKLDLIKAVELGLADCALLDRSQGELLSTRRRQGALSSVRLD